MPATQEKKIPQPGDLVRLNSVYATAASIRYCGLGLYLKHDQPAYAVVYWFRLRKIAVIHSNRVVLEQ